MTILIFYILAYVLLSISLYFLFPKAGVDGIKGLIPGVNFAEWCKIVGRKPTYALWLLVPIVNIFALAYLCVEMMRSFGKFKFWHSAVSIIYAPAAFFWLAFSDAEYVEPNYTAEQRYNEQLEDALKAGGPKSRAYQKLAADNPYKKGPVREWVEAIFFAVFAAAFIRMFLIEAYQIPTSSMEGSLLVGDYLFVSKAHYGVRTPKTVAMFPLLHNRLPFFNTESYLENPSLPFFRLPALESIDRNDPLVFNHPEGDSVYITPGRTFSINDVRRNDRVRAEVAGLELVTRPVDKMDHYIKRVTGTPGDTLQIIDRQVYIDGEPLGNSAGLQLEYLVKYEGQLNTSKFLDWGINIADQYEDQRGSGTGWMILILSEGQIEKIKTMDPSIEIMPNNTYVVRFKNDANPQTLIEKGLDSRQVVGLSQDQQQLYAIFDKEEFKTFAQDTNLLITPYNPSPGRLFPHDKARYGNWTMDNFGPIYIPKEGATIALTPDNMPFYRRIISNYEKNTLEERDGKVLINGVESETYTFKQSYYWGMGDNRHNSEDSRVWGYIPETHVVGKPLFIFFSTERGSMSNGIRWNRIMTGATKMD